VSLLARLLWVVGRLWHSAGGSCGSLAWHGFDRRSHDGCEIGLNVERQRRRGGTLDAGAGTPPEPWRSKVQWTLDLPFPIDPANVNGPQASAS